MALSISLSTLECRNDDIVFVREARRNVAPLPLQARQSTIYPRYCNLTTSKHTADIQSIPSVYLLLTRTDLASEEVSTAHSLAAYFVSPSDVLRTKRGHHLAVGEAQCTVVAVACPQGNRFQDQGAHFSQQHGCPDQRPLQQPYRH